MTCLSEEILREKIDGELTEGELAKADAHLSSCMECQRRFDEMAQESRQVQQALSMLEPGEEVEPGAALAHFQERVEAASRIPERVGAIPGFFARHPVPAWAGTALTALMVTLAVFAPARSLAQRFLAMLRVEKIAVVPVDLPVSPGPNTEAAIRNFISDSVVVTLNGGKPQLVSSLSQASQFVGFPVRGISNGPGTPQIDVVGERAFVMTLNRGRLQEILNELGRPDLQIPASVDGKTVAVHIPKTALIRYGNCPTHKPGITSPGSQTPAPSDATAGCVVLVEAPSPIVSVPPELNISQLAEVALQAAGMSEEEADDFCQTVDWTSTLVIPIPSRASSYQQQPVDGVEGELIVGSPRGKRPARYDLIWVKSGIIYSIMGSGEPQNAVAFADSLSG